MFQFQLAMKKLVPLALALVGTACLDNELEPTADGAAPSTYFAFARDFAPYKDWMTSETDVQDDHGGIVGKTTVYVSKMPDKQTHAFDVGSMLVKTMAPSGTDELTIHAMSKRGVGFNVSGAQGWEYFELLLNSDGSPFILWRGAAPPSGEMYQSLLTANDRSGQQLEGDCNSCHADGRDGMLGDDVLELLDSQ